MPNATTQFASLRSYAGLTARQLRDRLRQWQNQPSRRGNIAMLHAGRCGSSVLADLLNQHPDVYWNNEPFEGMSPFYRHLDDDIRAEQLLNHILFAQKTPYFGFDSKYLPEQHLSANNANKTPEQYIVLLEQLGFGHFILLNRKNHLRRAVSIAIGQKTGTWNSQRGPEQKVTAHLSTDHFISYGKTMPLLDFFQSLDSHYQRIRDAVRRGRVLELSYEDDIQANPEQAYRKACDFIGLTPQPVEVRLKKMNPHPLHELIDNVDEITALLTGTAYEWMLDKSF